jgi:hypothetical protein
LLYPFSHATVSSVASWFHGLRLILTFSTGSADFCLVRLLSLYLHRFLARGSLTRVLREVNEHGLLRDEQFWFRPAHSTTLQLARLAERVNRNFDERRQTGAVFLDVAKAFDIVWVKGLL